MKNKKRTILYADDDIEFLKPCFIVLEHEANCLVMPYSNGTELVRDVEQGLGYDLAIVDLSMDNESGPDIANRLKILHKDKPIVLTSGHLKAEYEARKYIKLSCDSYLGKPYDTDVLIRAINNFFPETKAVKK